MQRAFYVVASSISFSLFDFVRIQSLTVVRLLCAALHVRCSALWRSLIQLRSPNCCNMFVARGDIKCNANVSELTMKSKLRMNCMGTMCCYIFSIIQCDCFCCTLLDMYLCISGDAISRRTNYQQIKHYMETKCLSLDQLNMNEYLKKSVAFQTRPFLYSS